MQTVATASDRQPQARRFHYAWVIFVVAFITLLGAAGFRSTPGILIDPLGKDFGHLCMDRYLLATKSVRQLLRLGQTICAMSLAVTRIDGKTPFNALQPVK